MKRTSAVWTCMAAAVAVVLLADRCAAQGEKLIEQGRLVYSKPKETISRMQKVFPASLDGGSAYSGSVSITQQCQRDLLATLVAQEQLKEWAWTALDAAGQVGPGVYLGNLNYLGNFDQCQSVKASHETYTINVGGKDVQHEHTSDGKYCRVYWRLNTDYTEFASMGDCVPESCTKADMQNIYALGNDSLPVTYVYCDEGRDFTSDRSAIAGLVVTVVVVVLVLTASLAHAIHWCKNCPKQCQSYDLPAATAAAGGGGKVSSDIPLSTASNGANNNEISPDVQTSALPQVDNSAVSGQEMGVSKPDKPNKALDVFLCFSLGRNVPPLVATKSRSYSCMNGLRVLAMVWVLYGHSYQLGKYLLTDPRLSNLENRDAVYTTKLQSFPYATIVENNALPVEIFFVLAGSLVTISFMKALDRNGGKQSLKQMVMYYVHRYIRLTPVYMFVLMLFACFFPYLDNGPTPPELMEYNQCREKWWINLLYLQNILQKHNSCMGWTWYMANDWAYYCVAPLFVYFLYRCAKGGRAFLVITYIVYAAVRLTIYFLSADYFHDVYIPPWTRIGPYLMGIGLGNAMFVTKCRVPQMNKALLTFLWILVGVLLVLVFQSYPHNVSFKGDLMALATCIVVFLCCSGYGGFVNGLLSWSFFVPLARLTYVTYLVHPILIYYHAEFAKRQIYMEPCSMFFMYHGFLLCSFIIAFFITLVFELPFLELEKRILPQRG